MADDVADEEKRRRFQAIEALQKTVSTEKMRRYLGRTVEVLVEGQDKGRWRGRTPHNKLVFFDDPGQWVGQLVDVTITHAGPWSMSGKRDDHRPPTARSSVSADRPQPLMAEAIPLVVL